MTATPPLQPSSQRALSSIQSAAGNTSLEEVRELAKNTYSGTPDAEKISSRLAAPLTTAATRTWQLATEYGPPAAAKTANATVKVAKFYDSHVPWFVKLPLEAGLLYKYAPFSGAIKALQWAVWAGCRYNSSTSDATKTAHKKLAIQTLQTAARATEEKIGALAETHPAAANVAKKVAAAAHELVAAIPECYAAGRQMVDHVGDPIVLPGGDRVPIKPGPSDPLGPLRKIQGELATTFDQRQPPYAHHPISSSHPPATPSLDPSKDQPPPATSDQPAVLPAPTDRIEAPAAPSSSPITAVALQPPILHPRAIGPRPEKQAADRRADTNQQLQQLTENFSRFLPCYAMISFSKIPTKDFRPIYEMVLEASTLDASGNRPTIKQVFLNWSKRHGAKLSFIQRIKIQCVHLIASSRLFSFTIESYGKHLLCEMRERLAKDWTIQPKNTERMIRDLIHFCDLYKTATFAYADSTAPNGIASEYRDQAFATMFGTLRTLCNQFSKIILTHLSPKIEFYQGTWFLPHFANWALNGMVRGIIGHYLPRGIESVITQANEIATPSSAITQANEIAAPPPSYLPYSAALTTTAIAELEKLQQSLEKGALDKPPPPIPGTGRLSDLIAEFIDVIEISTAGTRAVVIQQKRKEIVERAQRRTNVLRGLEETFDEKVEQGIQETFHKGFHLLLHHFAKPENSEDAFRKFFELANAAFSKGGVVTDKDYAVYTESKKELDLLVENIGSQVAKKAVKEVVHPEYSEQNAAHAADALKDHQQNARSIAIYLKDTCQTLSRKIERLEQGDSESDILPDLDQMRQEIGRFSKREQIASDLEKLPSADREGIQQSLYPIYQTTEQIANGLLRLQELQISQKSQDCIAKDFRQIETGLSAIREALSPEIVLEEHLPALQKAVDRIRESFSPEAPEPPVLPILADILAKMKRSFTAAESQTKKLKALLNLEQHMNDLQSAIEQNRLGQKKTSLGQIREALKHLPPEDAGRLNHLIQNLNQLTVPAQRTGLVNAWDALGIETAKLQARYERDSNDSLKEIPADIAPVQQMAESARAIYEHYRTEDARQMSATNAALALRIGELQECIEIVRLESRLQLKESHLGLIGGIGLGALSLFSPTLAAGVGGALHGLSRRGASLLQGGTASIAPGAIIGAQIAGSAAAAFAVSSIPVFGRPLAVAGSILGGGHAGSHLMDRVVSSGQEEVERKIGKFYKKAYRFANEGEMIKPAVRIAMHEIVAAFAPRPTA